MKITVQCVQKLVVGLLVLAVILWLSNPDQTPAIPDQAELQKLRHKNDSIQLLNTELTVLNQQLQHQSDSILLLLQQDQMVIQHLNQRKNETIRAIDHFDQNKLFSFFTNYRLKAESTSDSN